MGECSSKRCRKCAETKPAAEFSRNKTHRDGLATWCKSCRSRYRKENRGVIREYLRQYREANTDKVRGYREASREKDLEGAGLRREYLRDAVFDHYGRTCNCPGCDAIDELTIDHVNGDGRQHRAQIGSASTALHRWLVVNGFPDTIQLQVLCGPCNRSKGTGNFCRINHASSAIPVGALGEGRLCHSSGSY